MRFTIEQGFIWKSVREMEKNTVEGKVEWYDSIYIHRYSLSLFFFS